MSEADRAAFLQAIRAEQADMTARLVYADWLDESGDWDGELVRLLCEVQESGYAASPAWKRLNLLIGGLEAEIGRLDERARRLLACDCAERVLPLFEREYPGDERPRRAIETARRHAQGEASAEELHAAGAAADAARSNGAGEATWATLPTAEAAWDAAGAAAGAAWPAEAAVGTAQAAARFAERAVWGDAGDSNAEQRWQLCRAIEYRVGFVPLPTFDEAP